MNDSTPHPPQSEGNSERPAGGFFAWLRGLGISRPEDRWFAGVASGIAARAGIDPLIVRGIFVVLALMGGPGILLYVLAWLLLPDHSGRIHAEEIVRGRAETWVLVVGIVLAALLVFPIIFGIFGFGGSLLTGFWGWGAWGVPEWVSITFSVLWWTAVIGGGIWLFVWIIGQRSRSDSGASTAAGAATGPAAGAAAGTATGAAGSSGASADHSGSETRFHPEQQHPTVAAFEAADAAPAHATEQEAQPLEAGYVILSIALALLIGGAAALWADRDSAALWGGDSAAPVLSSVTIGLIAAVAVLAFSLIVAGVRGRTTGWVGALSWVGVVALLFTAVIPWGTRVQPFGNVTVMCCDTDYGEPGIAVFAGNVTLDLSALDQQQDAADFEVWLAAGSIKVALPEDQPTIVKLHLGAGNIRELRPDTSASDRLAQSGPFLSRTVSANLEGSESADVSTITVHLLAGNVEVRELDRASTDASDEEATPPAVTSELIAERESLREELDVLEWELENPTASAGELSRLERQHARLEDELAAIEQEIAR